MILNSKTGALVIEELPTIKDIEGGSILSNANYKLTTIINQMYVEVCKEHIHILNNVAKTVVVKVNDIEWVVAFTLASNTTTPNFNGVVVDYEML